MLSFLRRLTWFAAACLALTGCAATHFENYPLAARQTNQERRAVDVSHSERPLILVAISGGGSRAAALGWVILRELGKFHYSADNQTRNLTDDIGVVSSVSGGSVIAAHFALNGAQGLERFAPDFLEPDNMRTLSWRQPIRSRGFDWLVPGKHGSISSSSWLSTASKNCLAPRRPTFSPTLVRRPIRACTWRCSNQATQCWV